MKKNQTFRKGLNLSGPPFNHPQNGDNLFKVVVRIREKAWSVYQWRCHDGVDYKSCGGRLLDKFCRVGVGSGGREGFCMEK